MTMVVDAVTSPMEFIRISDVDSRTWLSQNATGVATSSTSSSDLMIPDPRLLGCTASAWAPDNSSYNIYLFGGQRQLRGERTKDLWVLSLPSFTCIKAGDDSAGGIGHSCARVGRHMFAIGSGEQDETTCQPFFRILDMATLEWTNAYDPSSPDYVVPPAIHATIGGDEMGGAKVIKPPTDSRKSGNWTRLRTVFEQTPWGRNGYFSFTDDKATPSITAHNTTPGPSMTPTDGGLPGNTSSPPPLSGAQTAGIAVGSTVAGLLLVALLVACVILWNRGRASKHPRKDKKTVGLPTVGEDQDQHLGELHGDGVIQEIGTTR
ncbi:hypothetical protein QBC37DRAFT_393624 [Rhypophila decipiens]|uniref:Kelch repeat protein n=1 Tax=Rhypophila decipiens TaxID=261697 RepID=A0AAN6XSY9_9PEZI|nr:hypothetical protein QBC37DRAFT_393624 [Rhypophila decipiens]